LVVGRPGRALFALPTISGGKVNFIGALRGITAPRAGGLTGSYAGLSASITDGPGVEGVDCGAHFVPKPRVTDDGLCATGVVGAGGNAALTRLAAFGVAAWRIICSGIAGLGGCTYGLGVTPVAGDAAGVPEAAVAGAFIGGCWE
jgi:hypothetical protein